MTGHISNVSVSSIETDCVKGVRNVSVHVGAQHENGVWCNATLGVWVSEEITEIDAIKQEALRLAKIFASDISVSDLLPTDSTVGTNTTVIEEALEPEY